MNATANTTASTTTTTSTTIRHRLLATCRPYGSNSREIVMRCSRCGKHFAVDVWVVANRLRRGEQCKCSACGTATLEPVRKGDEK